MGMYGLGIVVAPAVGPTLGGYLVEYVDWRLIFFINVPIGVIGTLAAMFYLPSFGRAKAPKFDLPGFLAIASGLFALLIALHEGEKWGWTSYPVIILLVYGVLAIALGIAVLSAELFGVSMALGAFLAGMVVGQSEFSYRAASEALPMRDAFAVLFFVSVGMLLHPRFVFEAPGLVAATLGVILIGKPLIAFVLVLNVIAKTIAGHRRRKLEGS